MIVGEIVNIWVAAFTEKNTDLHNGNYGVDRQGFFVSFDDDRAIWPLTSKYGNIHPEVDTPYDLSPISSFKFTARDIVDFPYLTDAQPWQWFDRMNNQQHFDLNIMDDLKKDPKFIYDKFYSFLKRILFSREIYEAGALATISSPNTRQKFVEERSNTTEELKQVLINMPEFQDFILANPKVINQLKTEFEKYNQNYPKEKDAYLRINLDTIQKNFDGIVKEVQLKRSSPSPHFNFFAIAPTPREEENKSPSFDLKKTAQ